MRLLLVLSLLLACCSRPAGAGPAQAASTEAEAAPAPVAPAASAPKVEDPVPYPSAKAPSPMPAVAAAPDSDCGGLIELPPGRPRVGTWAVGETLGESFTPMLFFNTERSARSCAGSSGLKVRRLTREGWR